ncbi:hypothetical protein FQN54_007041 [Arachnomyces sp. PD_36]|nr:hypothetical protein FQN54_007041 [Arachnomyces sp. PD_36]
MTYVRRRTSSPGGGRIVDPMRSSTGNLPVGSTNDPYHSSTRSRDGYSSSTGREPVEITKPTRYWEASGLRLASSHNGPQMQPLRPVEPRNNSKPTTEYSLRPRSHTDAGRRPRSLIVPPSAERQSPIAESDYERARSPRPKPHYAAEDADPYLYPATSPRTRYHYRVPGAYESDTGHLAPSDAESRARMDRRKHRSSGSGATKGYPASGSVVKYRKEDFDNPDAFSYTNPEEQFDRDSIAGEQSRRANHNRKERPRSMTGLDGYRQQLELRREPRDPGPPPARGIDRLRTEDGYLSPRSQYSSRRAPVSLHKAGDDGYSSYQEDYGGSRGYHRSQRYEDGSLHPSRPHPQGTRDEKLYPVDSSRRHAGSDASGAESATGHPRDSHGREYGYRGASDRRSAREYDAEYARRRNDGKSDARSADEAARIRHLRREAARRNQSDSDADDYTTDEDRRRYLHPQTTRPREPESPSGKHRQRDEPRHDRHRGSDVEDSDSRRHPRHSRHKDTDDEEASDSRRPPRHTRRDTDDEEVSDSRRKTHEDRLRKSHAHDRAPSKEPEPPTPKGILKPPRDKFPEDKNAVREGVAPLKDATKAGIPPGARWTKIDRRRVNPAALEARQERFEERPDCVIVLRVLTREEIQELAEETQKIREERYEAERRERRRRRGGDERRLERGRRDYDDGSDADTSSDDDDEEDDEDDDEFEDAKAQMAIEAPSRHHPPESRS